MLIIAVAAIGSLVALIALGALVRILVRRYRAASSQRAYVRMAFGIDDDDVNNTDR